MISLHDVNRRNRAFWEDQGRAAQPLLAQPLVVKWAVEEIASEQRLNLPIKLQRDFHQVLIRFGDFRRQALGEMAQAGGRARKPDALQAFIREIVAGTPAITRNELLERLREHAPGPVVVDIDKEDDEAAEISFVGPGEQLRRASLSGLKDRLSRAKRTIGNRTNR